MERHVKNAKEVARYLSNHPKAAWVTYPSLPGHPDHETGSEIPAHWVRGPSWGLVYKGGLKAGKKFIDSLKLFSHLANVGDAKSLAIHPASTTHSQLSAEGMEAAGVSADFIRLSIGIEDIEDILWDLEQALAVI